VKALGLGLLLTFAACTAPPPRPPIPPSPSPPAPAPTPTPTTSPAPEPHGGPGAAAADAPLSFIENDYARALADARARRVPLFVDAWAPWCHTCMSLKSYVLPDPALRRFGPRFVWLSIDTEREQNAALVARLDVRVLPMLFVIDPASEQPVVAWPGSLTPTELASLLEDAETAARRGGGYGGGQATADLLRGHRASAAGKRKEAIEAYRAALAEAPADWPKRAEAVDALVTRLGDDGQSATCVTTAADQAPKMPPGTALADVLREAMSCAGDLPKSAPERARLPDLVALGERVASDASQPILADDRSDLYDYVQSALRDLGHVDEANRVTRAWAAFLEDEASRAPTPAARAVFDAHRLLAYMALGEPQRAVPMLEQSERDLPDDYNPPARLATAYLKMKRYDDALAAVGRALGRAYGPRKLRLWSLQADIEQARGNQAAAREALRQALDFARTVPLTGAYPKLRDALAKRLGALH
jgi:tetratricopeptide (TPR) repeat protein